MGINRLVIDGRLTKDPQVKSQPGKTLRVFFVIAQNGPKEEVDFFPISLIGELAEYALQNLTQGTRVVIEGKIKMWKSDDRQGLAIHVEDLQTVNPMRFVQPPPDTQQAPEDPAHQQWIKEYGYGK